MDVVVSEGAEKERNQPMVAAWFAVKGRSHFFQLGDEAPHQNQVDFVSCAKNWSVGLHIIVRFVMSNQRLWNQKTVYMALCCDRSEMTTQLFNFLSQNLSLV